MTPQFTPEELDRMRQIIAAADATQGMKGIREFDLNNPPKEPYTHKEYPRVMYHHAKKITQMANSDKDVAALLKKGFVKNPPVEAPPPEETDVDMTETGQA